jgi:LysR family transcriptional regulator, transcriptional activator of nhaA
MINLNHLRYFYICAQKKSVTEAAKALGISQPSLSQQLKVFEGEMGQALFVRNGPSIELSLRGRALYEQSKPLFEIADSLTGEARDQDVLRRRSFRIGVSDDIDRPFVAEIVGRTLGSRLGQRIKFDVISKKHREIVDGFNSSEFDVVIVNEPFGRKAPLKSFAFPVFLITAMSKADFKQINESNLNVVLRLLEQRLVVPTKGLTLRSEVEAQIKKLTELPEIVFESNILACSIRAIREGIGCGFIPLPYIRDDYRRGLVQAIGPKAGYWKHRVHFYASERAESQVVQNLIQVTSEYEA